jgi:hypothetical protein
MADSDVRNSLASRRAVDAQSSLMEARCSPRVIAPPRDWACSAYPPQEGVMAASPAPFAPIIPCCLYGGKLGVAADMQVGVLHRGWGREPERTGRGHEGGEGRAGWCSYDARDADRAGEGWWGEATAHTCAWALRGVVGRAPLMAWRADADARRRGRCRTIVEGCGPTAARERPRGALREWDRRVAAW